VPVPVEIEVRLADGTLETRSFTFYETRYGPVVNLASVSPLLGSSWGKSASSLIELTLGSTGGAVNWARLAPVPLPDSSGRRWFLSKS